MFITSFKYSNHAAQQINTGMGIATVGGDNRLRIQNNDDSGRQRFIKLSGSPTQLASRAFSTSRVVDAIGGNLTAPTQLQIYPAHGGPNQLWEITETGNFGSGVSGYKLYKITAAGTDMAWDIPNGDISSGNSIQIYPFHGGDNQFWRQEAKSIEAVVIKSAYNQRVLDVPGFESGWWLIQHFPANGGFNQAWEIEGDPGDPQRIRSVSSGRYLASLFVSEDNFSSVIQARGSASNFQRWKIDLDSNGIGTVENVETGLFLSVATGAGTYGAELRCLPANGSAQQQWQFVS